MESITLMINHIGELLDAVANVVPKIVTTCALLTTIAHKPSGGFLLKAYNAINYAALNVGKAKNAE